MSTMTGNVVAVHASPLHSFSKAPRAVIRLLAGLGVEGDAHCGATMRHRGRLPLEADKPNLRQVHLIHAELLDALQERGFDVHSGDMGENVTTVDLDLLALPRRTRLRLGAVAVVELTGLRNPCRQLDGLAPGLMHATLDHTRDGRLIRLAGVMGVVVIGGDVRPGDGIEVDLPAEREPLQPV